MDITANFCDIPALSELLNFIAHENGSTEEQLALAEACTSLALPMANCAIALIEPEALFSPVNTATLEGLFTKYAADRKAVEELADVASRAQYSGVLDHFIRGNAEDHHGAPIGAGTLFQLDGALRDLNACYWREALALTDVYEVMPQERRTTWDVAIEKRDVRRFFAERVDGLFRALSGDHVTNSPMGFGKRMIINWIHNGWHADSRRVGYISDLRAVVAKFMGRGEPRWQSSNAIVDIARQHHGQWIDVDGGALRLRVYKKGTAHLEVHPEMAWRLNAVLASIHPRAIPAEHRTRQPRPARGFRVMLRPLPFPVLEVLEDMRSRGTEEGGRRFNLPYGYSDLDRSIAAEFERVVEAIGGAVVAKEWAVLFDYPAAPVVDEVLASGCIPDKVSHQYYPTPPEVARLAVEMAQIGDHHSVLEPSAGQGGLASLLPPARTTCVEISALHCKILRGRGFNVDHADFILWARDLGDVRFDRVVMNPPFAGGRHSLHVRVAAQLLAPQGRLVAVLPASLRSKAVLPEGEFSCEWSDVMRNEFDGTGMAVAVLAATRV